MSNVAAFPERAAEAPARWRGHVERLDPAVGIEGWALSVEAPGRPVELELVVGDDALAIAATTPARTDAAGRPVFRFGPEVFARLARLADHRAGRSVGVRVAGTDIRLPGVLCAPGGPGEAPTVEGLVAAWRASVLGRLGTQETAVTKGDRLLMRLGALRADAGALRTEALRPFSDNEVGQIDAVHLAGEGQVWFVGWMKRGVELEFPAVVVDRQKYPSGVSVLQYERSELNTSCVGVIGLMDTGWTPPAVAKDGFVYVGRNGQYHLRYGAHTRLLRAEAFLAAYGQAQPVAIAGPVDAMGQVLNSGTNWLPGNAAAAGIVAEGGVDRLLMLPGFGCLAEGWAVSPAKRVESFHMKIGDCVLVADEASTYFRPRPDLASVFGGGPSTTERAGFVAALRGALPANAAGVPLLRVLHDDGTMAVSRIEAKALRRLDLVSDGEEVLRLFPSLRFEPFYPSLLDAVRRMLAGRARRPSVLAAEPSVTAIVLRLPTDDHGMRLWFDRIARHAGDLAPDTGLVLLTDQGRGRSEAMLHFRELREAVDGPLSLLSLAHGEDGIDELPFILTDLGIRRFVHVGRGVLPTAAGWRQMAQSLERRGHFIDRFEIVDDTGRPDRVDGALSAACFGWSTAALIGWSVGAPRFLRGVHGGNGLPETPGRDHVAPGAAIRIERPRTARLADMIDADLLAAAVAPARPAIPSLREAAHAH